MFNNKITKDIKLLKGTTHVYGFRNDSLELFKYLKINHPSVKKILEVPVFQRNLKKILFQASNKANLKNGKLI